MICHNCNLIHLIATILLLTSIACAQENRPATSQSTTQPAKANPFYLSDPFAQPTVLNAAPAQLADQQVLRLWPTDAPLAKGSDLVIDVPTMTVYLPKKSMASGSAMVIFPGGGYGHLSSREGLQAARWATEAGMVAFVVKYRLGSRYHHPAELTDAQRAVRYVRAHARRWSLNADRIGIIGFSAGGHLASTLATHFDAGDPKSGDEIEQVSCRPDVHVLIYPVISLVEESLVHARSRDALLGENSTTADREQLSNERQVSTQTPPAFIVHSTEDKSVPVGNSDRYVQALIQNNIPFSYVRGPMGGHGFGVTEAWSGQAIAWLRARHF